MTFHSENSKSNSGIRSLPLYAVAFVVWVVLVAGIFSTPAVVAELGTPIPPEVHTLTINGTIIKKEHVHGFKIRESDVHTATVTYTDVNPDGTFNDGTRISLIVRREATTLKDHLTVIEGKYVIFGDDADFEEFRIVQIHMIEDREININISPNIIDPLPTHTPQTPLEARLFINGSQLTMENMKEAVGQGEDEPLGHMRYFFEIPNGKVYVSIRPNKGGGFPLGQMLIITPVAEGDDFIIDTPNKANCSFDCRFMVVMNERQDLVISIKRLTGKKPEPTLTPEPMLTPEPTLTFEPTPTPKFSSTPTPKGFENIHQEFEFKVTIDKENLEDFIEGLKESAEADDIKLLPGGLMLWAETEGFSSEKIDVLSNRLETYDLMVPIPRGQSIGKPMTFHLGVLTKNKPFALGSKSSFNLNFDVLGRDDKKLLRDSILLKIKPETNDDWFIAILNHPERIFVGLLVMLYGISLLISREVRSMSWTAIRFFLPSSRLESKQVMDRLDGIQDALGSTNYLRQPNSGSSRQRSETSDALETGLRDLKAEIQRNTGTINTLQQRLSSELDKDSASRQAADALPGAERERRDLSDKIISLGELLRNSVAEIVAEQALANASEYWAVEDRKQLLARISVHLEEQEAKRLENLEHISDTIRQLRALNVRQSLQKIEDLSRPEMAGIENSETIAAILDDMLASVPRRPIRPEIIEQIDAFSSHVEGLGITSRFIPGALVEICRELVADSSPEEVDWIEIIISRVIELARARF